MTSRCSALALGGVLLVGLILRCDHVHDRTVWFDEAFSYTLVANFSPWEIVARTADDVHPPLYYLALWVWTRSWGTSPVALRSLSILFGVATIGWGYLVARDATVRSGDSDSRAVRGPAAGLAAATLIATSAAQIRWSWEARMYTLATLLLLIGLWCALRALDATSRRAGYWWTGFACSTAALLYTHNYGLFSFVGIGFWLLLELSRADNCWRWPWRSPAFPGAAISTVAVGWAYLPWVPVLLAQKSQVQDDYWIPPIDWWTLPRAWYSLLIPTNGASSPGDTAAALMGAVLVGFAVLMALRFERLDRLALSLWLTPVLIAVVISLISVPVIVDRHFLLSQLCALLGLGGLVATAGSPLRYWTLLGLLALDGLVVVNSYRNELDVSSKPGICGAMEYALANRKADEPILVLHPCIYFSAQYYAQGKAPVAMYIPPDRVTHYTGGPIVREADFFPLDGLAQVTGRRLWVLNTDGFSPGSTGTMIPIGWTMRHDVRFPDVYHFQGSISVTQYERRSPLPSHRPEASQEGEQTENGG